jgi:hypothetical protein
MFREAIEVGAFTWSRIQRLYESDATTHWQHCESDGLQCPQEVFTQLFHEQSTNEDFAVIVRTIDWGGVRWELQEISGIALRHIRVDREYQHALDEARDQATRFGIVDERQDVVDHWRDAKSWIVPGAGLELLIGYTRLGNLLALLDRQEVPEIQKHLVWVGRAAN